MKVRDRVGQKQLLDSLDQVFYAAREKNDSREMEEIKRTTAPIYNNAYKQLRSWFDTKITAQRGTPFGIISIIHINCSILNLIQKKRLMRQNVCYKGLVQTCKILIIIDWL